MKTQIVVLAHSFPLLDYFSAIWGDTVEGQ